MGDQDGSRKGKPGTALRARLGRASLGVTFARALRGRRRRVAVAGLVALLLVLRAALPSFVRRQIESRASAAVAGSIHVGDVDLWLVRGAIALRDVSFQPEGAPPGAPPFAQLSRLYVNLGWLSLLRHTIRLQTIELDDPVIRLERTRSGEIPLPALRASPAPAEARAAPAPGKPWNVEVDRAFLHRGALRLVDQVAEPAELRSLELDGVELAGFTLHAEAGAAPGHGTIVARFGDGTLRIGVGVDTHADGLAFGIKLEAVGLPLERLQLHAPELGWNALGGRLDASLEAQMPPRALPSGRGTVTLRDVAVEVPGEDAPVLGWKKIEIAADAFDVAARRLELGRIEIDEPTIVIERGKSGVVDLPVLRGGSASARSVPGSVREPTLTPAPAPTPGAAADVMSPAPQATTASAMSPAPVESPAPVQGTAPAVSPESAVSTEPTMSTESAASSEPAPPWDVSVGRATLRAGHVRLIDRAVEPVQTVALELEGITLAGFTLQRATDHKPGEGSIEARFGDGVLKLATHIDPRANGFAIDATADAANIPLDQLYLHVPALGWSGFKGRLDGHVVFRVEPGAFPTASGALALRDLLVEVPAEAAPVLAWRKLAVEVESIDPGARRAALKSVALEGADVVVRPRAAVPLPLLAGLSASSSNAPQAPDVQPSPQASPSPSPPAPAARAWTWSVGELDVGDSVARVELAPPPLAVAISHARLTGLSSDPGAAIGVDAEVRAGSGGLTVRGSVKPQPLAADLTTHVEDLPLGLLLEAVGGAPVALPSGAASGDLGVQVADGGVALTGKLAVADLALVPREGKDFSAGWKRLELDLRKLQVPPGPGAPEPSPPAAGPPTAVKAITLDIDGLRLLAPVVSLTRTAEGIVLPGSPAPPPGPGGPVASPSGVPPQGAAAAATPAPGSSPPAGGAAQTTAATPAVEVRIARLDVDDGALAVVDRNVRPYFRGTIGRIGLRARGLRYPDSTFQSLTLDARLPGDAPLAVRASRDPSGVQVDATLDGLPLAQLNPYVAPAAGYSLASGSATVHTSAWLGPTYYNAWNDLAFDDLELAGAEGDTLFADRFGVPLSLALALLRSPGGRISLGVPIEGDRERGARVDLKPVVTEAIAKAILGAITSPLKLIGAVALGGGKVAAVAPAPIGFVPGRADVADDAWWRLGELSNALGSYPGLRLTLRGGTGVADVRALQEAAVLADLQKDQGVVGVLRTLGSRGDRNAVRAYLEASSAGKAAELDEARRPALEKWVSEKSVSDEELRTLATARAKRLEELLEKDYGVGQNRLALGEPSIAREEGKPEVAVGVGR